MQYLLPLIMLLQSAGGARRIINGELTPEHLYPSTVALLVSRKDALYPHCTGLVVGKRTVVTTAHCVQCIDFARKELYVQSGANDLRRGQRREVTKVKCDKDARDIALLLVDTPFPNETPVAAIPADTTTFGNHTECQIASWGKQDNRTTAPPKTMGVICGGSYPCRQRFTTMTIISRDECRKKLWDINNKEDLDEDLHEFCTIGNSTNICAGDSGAPVYCGGDAYGLSSWSLGCDPGLPLVNILTPYFKRWIETNVKQLEANI